MRKTILLSLVLVVLLPLAGCFSITGSTGGEVDLGSVLAVYEETEEATGVLYQYTVHHLKISLDERVVARGHADNLAYEIKKLKKHIDNNTADLGRAKNFFDDIGAEFYPLRDILSPAFEDLADSEDVRDKGIGVLYKSNKKALEGVIRQGKAAVKKAEKDASKENLAEVGELLLALVDKASDYAGLR